MRLRLFGYRVVLAKLCILSNRPRRLDSLDYVLDDTRRSKNEDLSIIFTLGVGSYNSFKKNRSRLWRSQLSFFKNNL